MLAGFEFYCPLPARSTTGLEHHFPHQDDQERPAQLKTLTLTSLCTSLTPSTVLQECLVALMRHSQAGLGPLSQTYRWVRIALPIKCQCCQCGSDGSILHYKVRLSMKPSDVLDKLGCLLAHLPPLSSIFTAHDKPF